VITKSTLRRFALAFGLLLVLFNAGPARAQSEPESEAALLARVEDYLNAITTMQANFMQVNHDGSISEGTLVIARPGLMRIDYEPPMQVRIISDGKWITYFDGELGQASQAPLNGTHAELLLRADLRFGRDVEVVALKHETGVVEITVTRLASPGEGTLTLVFADRPLELRQWAVVDTQGLSTQVTLFDTRFGIAVDPALFEAPAPYPEETR
jgi:outer membrane lipoprotein-sorting protein